MLNQIITCFSITFTVKKEGWGGGGTRVINFSKGETEFPLLKTSGKSLNVSIAAGLPRDTSRKLCYTIHI